MKHARPDYDRIQDPEGKIPDDEPVFLLRGQDPVAASAVVLWAELAEVAGASPEIVALARRHADAMHAWAQKAGKQFPDLPRDKSHV